METKKTALDLALLVEQMRRFQKKYFQLARKAKAKKTDEDYKEQRALLERSKEFEFAVDNMVEEIISNNSMGPGARKEGA